MILSTRNFAASQAIGRTLLLLAVTGLLSACLSNGVVDDPRDTSVVTPVPLTPTASLEETEPSVIEPQETEAPQVIESTATSTLYPTAAITIEA